MTRENTQGRLIGAVILIALGVIFLLREVNIPFFDNWWAVFILIPGLVILWNAYVAYNRDRSFTTSVIGQGIVGGVLTLLGAAFLFDISLGFLSNLWPLILIAGGVALLLRRSE